MGGRNLKNIGELYLGFSDAQNYSQRKNKNAFNEIFVRNHYLLIEKRIVLILILKFVLEKMYHIVFITDCIKRQRWDNINAIR